MNDPVYQPNKPWLPNPVLQVIQNVAVWYDGTLRPGRGHDGTCRWGFDGQVWYHKSHRKLLTNLPTKSTMKTNQGSNLPGKEQ